MKTRAFTLPLTKLLVIMACLSISFIARLQAREQPFDNPVTIDNLTGSSNIFYSTADAGDIDSDGDQDFVIADRGDVDTLYWYENDGTGSSWTAHLIDDNGFSNLEKLQLTDLDGDGDLDVLAADSVLDAVYWFENGGSSWTQHTIDSGTTDLNNVSEARAADMDNDGDLDVVAASPSSNKILVYSNTAGDASSWSQTLNQPVTDARALDLGDWDMDGTVDILVGAGTPGDLFRIYYNSGTSSESFGSSTGSVYAVRLADMDGNGTPEILTSVAGSGGISVWFDAGFGTWTESVVATGIGNRQLETRDMDHDGDLDIIASNNGGKVAWFENSDGQGTSWSERVLSSTGGNSEAALPLDVDNDGDIDLVATRSNTGDIELFRNDDIHYSTALFQQSDVDGSFSNVSNVVVFDVDGDGNDDVVAADRTAGVQINWYAGNGDGSFGPAQSLLTLPSATDSNVIALRKGDLDKDGDIDLAFATDSHNAIYTLMNPYDQGPFQPLEKGSTVWTQDTVATGLGSIFDLQLADMNGDGMLDLITVDRTAGTVVWFANDGLWAPHSTTLTTTGTHLSTGDLDGDGTVDLVVNYFNSSTLQILQNTAGDGSSFVTSTHSTTSPTERIQLADMDRDGDLDIAVLHYGTSNHSEWLANNGSAAGWTAHDTGLAPGSASYMRVTDIDHDGDPDWVIAASGDSLIKWLENTDGIGDSWSEHTELTGINAPSGLDLSDINQDGRLDWAFAAQGDNQVGILLNRGGQFRLSSTGAPAQAPEDDMITEVLAISATHAGSSTDADIELSSLRLAFVGISASCPITLTDTTLNPLVASIRLYQDDGDGVFEQFSDTLVTSDTGPFTPIDGEYSLALPDQSPAVQLAPGETKDYFVALQYRSNASAQACHAFIVYHLTDDSSVVSGLGAVIATSRAQHRNSGLLLQMEHSPNEFTGLISLIPSTNGAPTSSGIPDFSVDEDVAISMDLSGYFSDPDGDTLHFTATGLPASLSLSGDGTLSGTPTNSDSLQPPFLLTITAIDPQGASVAENVTLTVNPINDAPVFSGTIPDQNSQLGMLFSLDVSSYFIDPDGDSLSYSVSGAPAVLSINASGVISGTPDLATVGNSPFNITVTATDPSGLSVSSNTFLWEASDPNDLAFSDSFE